ncbi:MAG: ATP synthase F1 subunit delta [Oscillospiraceae bacterium]|nr:ATP synthase F1 subunit delta [Oscillospiraceae bacterium]
MNDTAVNYANALYELAQDEALLQEIREQLFQVERLYQSNPDFVRLLSAPKLPKAERLSVLDGAFAGRVHPYVLSFLKLLCERGRSWELSACVDRFRTRWNEDHGVLQATVVTAVKLSESLSARLQQRLSAITGKQVDLTERVDPTVLGGVRLEYGGVQLDGTVRGRLAGLEKTLSETVL